MTVHGPEGSCAVLVMPRTIILLLVTTVGASWGYFGEDASQEISRKIINGVMAQKDEFPYAVDILRIHNRIVFPICGGTIVHDQIILTAAHCLRCKEDKQADVTDLYTVYKSTNLKTGKLAKIIKGQCHPDWDENTAKNDIALLKTAQKMGNPIPVKLALNDNFLTDIWANCAVLGWGDRTPSSRRVHKVTRKEYILKGVRVSCINNCDEYVVILPTIPLQLCIKALERATSEAKVYSDGSQMCAYAEHKDACQGDSGGPMICNGIQYGIISWGHGCAKTGVPGIYTRVGFFAGWLNDTIRRLIEDTTSDFIERKFYYS